VTKETKLWLLMDNPAIRKNWWPFGCAMALFLFIILVLVSLNTFRDSAYRVNYLHVVTEQYMVTQKVQTGKWPANLSGFSQSFRTHKKSREGIIDFSPSALRKNANAAK